MCKSQVWTCRKLARDNMPFMALEIHGLEEIRIRDDLPHSDSMVARYRYVHDDLPNSCSMAARYRYRVGR